jgi:hypothetical protein
MPKKKAPTRKATPRKKAKVVIPFAPRKKGRPRGRPFKKGHPPPPNAGRKKGVPNKLTRSYKEFLGALIEDTEVQKAVKAQIIAGEWQPYFKAISQLHGMPKVEVDAGPGLAKLLEMGIKAASE